MNITLAELIAINERNGYHYFKKRNLDVFDTEIASDILNNNYFLIKEPEYVVTGNNDIQKVSDEKFFFVNEVNWHTGFVCRAIQEKFTRIEDAKAAVYLLPQIDFGKNIERQDSMNLLAA